MSSEFDITGVFQGLRKLDATLIAKGADRNERADMLINACIGEGIETGGRIVGTLVMLSFNKWHAGIRLKGGVQLDPKWPGWGRNDDGTYFAPPPPPFKIFD